MFLPLLFYFPLLLLIDGAPATNKKALDKILIEKNPDTADNREKIRGIIKQAFKKRVPKVQGRQGVAPPAELVSLKGGGGKTAVNHGPKNNQSKKFEELNSEIHEYTFESDIMLNENQAKNLAKSIEHGHYRSKRQAIINTTLFWDPNVPISYQFDTTLLTATGISNIRKAIQFWNDNSCLSFTEDNNANNRLFMSSAGGCWSYVGKQVNMPYQVVSVGPGCDNLGTATHELMHAIGFWHQQSRADRDSYVYVDFSNVIPSEAYNFQKMPLDQAQLLNLRYDYGSVMQYDAYAFAVDSSKYTLLALQSGFQNNLGQRDGPAFSDILGVNTLYNCASRCQTQLTCSNCGFTDSRNCNQCKCPSYFTGPTCDSLPYGTAPNCNGAVLQATSTWQTFNALAGDPNSYSSSSDNATYCYWQIKAPAGQQVEFQMTTAPMSAICMQQCPWQAVEINMGYFDLSGMITCCGTLLNQVMTSVQNMMALRGIIRYNQLNFSFQYRAVPNQGTVSNTNVCYSN